jgi:hypothetical protein
MRSSPELSLRKAGGELVPHRPVELRVAHAKKVERVQLAASALDDELFERFDKE